MDYNKHVDELDEYRAALIQEMDDAHMEIWMRFAGQRSHVQISLTVDIKHLHTPAKTVTFVWWNQDKSCQNFIPPLFQNCNLYKEGENKSETV